MNLLFLDSFVFDRIRIFRLLQRGGEVNDKQSERGRRRSLSCCFGL